MSSADEKDGWTESENSDEEDAKRQAQEEFEIRQHQEMMKKRQNADVKKPFGSSKGFASMKKQEGQTEDDLMRSSFKTAP